MANDVVCSHPEICSLAKTILDESNTKNIEPKVAVKIAGDPHEYEPKLSEIKTLLKASVLLAGPIELNPWIKKVNYQRSKEKDLKTISLNLTQNLAQKYNNASKEVLAHFWLYPQVYCDLKSQLVHAMKDAALIPNTFTFNLNTCQSEANLIENRLKDTLSKSPYSIILTHDALLPLFEQAKGKDGVVAIKGSGHHHETRSDSVKKLYDFLKGPKAIWIKETGINVPKNILNKIRKDDFLIQIDTAKTLSSSPYSILEELIQKIGEIK